ncbi:MAG: DUF2283 domain-containing protein [Dehalococcoidia bacterium]|nr:DUF2283 domain-containing protein [Dehalococcoidia bacterium]
MKLTYDPRYNVAYLRLADASAPVRTIEVSDELNVDIDDEGTVHGIEFLNARRQLEDFAGATFSVENVATGDTVELALP